MPEEQTPAAHVEGNYSHCGNEQRMGWVHRMGFDAADSSYFSSSHDVVPDDCMMSYPVDAGPSSYCYGGGPYDYESGLADHF